MIWLYYTLLLIVSILGLLLNVVTLPGLWLMVAATAGYAWWTGFDVYVGWPSLVALLVLALLAEVGEFAASGAGAARAGGSKRATLGAILGALIGGVFFTGLVPIPLVGTIFGVCLGAFAGASIVELFIQRDVAHSLRVGTGAAKGRFYAILVKLAFGVVMLLIILIAAFPVASAPPLPASQPSAVPTTLEHP